MNAGVHPRAQCPAPRTHRTRGLLLAALGLTLLLTGLPWVAKAQSSPLSGEALEIRVRQITDQLRCPTCQGISVNDSEASFSVQIKDKVRRMLEEGQNEEQIKSYFVSRYGEWILRAPMKEGLGLVLWVLPFLMIMLVGGWLMLRVYRNQHGSKHAGADAAAAEVAPSAVGLTPEQQERIQRDLKRFEEQD